MANRRLSNDAFTSWFLAEVLRPYQQELTGIKKGDPKFRRLMLEDVYFYYGNLEQLAFEKIEWFEIMTDRLAQIYSVIETGFFPDKKQEEIIYLKLQSKGVKVFAYSAKGKGEPELSYR